jgi:predicted ribosome quality control (RQC) complex YloA/Tae2 family protein
MFDALTMAALAAELERTILGGRVQRALQTSPLSIGLEIYAQHRRSQLLASADAQNARVHLAEGRLTRDPQALSPFLLHLRRRVRGAILQRIETPALERILFLHFRHPALPPDEQEITLVVEVMGRHSNLILLDGAGLVIDCIKRVTPQMSTVRPVLPRQLYRLPPGQAKMDPRAVSPDGLGRALAGLARTTLLWQALVHLYRGVSPLLAREIVYRACGQTDAAVGGSHPLDRLASVLGEFWTRVESGHWEPCLALEDGRPAACAPYLLTHRPDWEIRTYTEISPALEQYYVARQPLGGHQQLRQVLRQAIARRKERLQKRLAALQDELDRANQAEELRQKGEWLLAYQHQIAPGQTQFCLEGLVITLDPQRSPLENAQTYFAAYRKAKHARRDQPQRIEETSQALAWLAEMTALVDTAESYDEIATLARELAEAGVLSIRPTAPYRKTALPPRTFRSRDGYTILVGRNARQNEELSLRRARPRDLWLHARGRPGAHVIVLTEGRPVPATTVEQAAALAAYYSQGRNENRVAVDCTECRYVHRAASGYPGLVHYEHERTLTVAPAQPLLENAPPGEPDEPASLR